MSLSNRNKFFANTYITGSGRQNYLRIDKLEDPLFTSFTFDVDYITSPLFYTIDGHEYGYKNLTSKGLAEKIEISLKSMRDTYMNNKDNGYDILPVLSANFLDENKLGFGLQQNVYMDMPLYGATEYIYMVDVRNGGKDQNDVRYDTNDFDNGNLNSKNSFKLGDTIGAVINESDKKWAEEQKKQHDSNINECNSILKDSEDKHKENGEELEKCKREIEDAKVEVTLKSKDGSEVIGLTEAQLTDRINELKKNLEELDTLKKDIVNWVNEKLREIKKQGNSIFGGNKVIQEIYKLDNPSGSQDEFRKIQNISGVPYHSVTDDDNKNTCDYDTQILYFKNETSFASKFLDLLNKHFTYNSKDGKFEYSRLTYGDLNYNKDNGYKVYGIWDNSNENADINVLLSRFIIYRKVKDSLMYTLRHYEILNHSGIKDIKTRLRKLDMLINDETLIKGHVWIKKDILPTESDWARKDNFINKARKFILSNDDTLVNQVGDMIESIMSFKCDMNCFSEDFTNDKLKLDSENLKSCENALNNLRGQIYGYSATGEICDSDNPEPGSLYDNYLKAKDIYENDDYSQAAKSKSVSESESVYLEEMLNKYEDYNIGDSDGDSDNEYDDNIVETNVTQTNNNTIQNSAPQTVLDMLGFITGMRKMTTEYPYIIQGVSGLDVAYNNNYGIKDPYLGSGDGKITLTCLESLDLRVSSMFNRYFNAVYDRQYRRERVPVNLRRFNCSIYVHDVRNFVNRIRTNQSSYNRILELTDMYYSVIEFKFFDCEIVPEETGNIFNDISNEAPSEMKKTNFTFTYGNCVVNFVPPSEV